ncbi:MAG: 2-C-methyl-D-erythritol 4-phosphate cytidylyltransferase [Thermomicrobiales bacterium]
MQRREQPIATAIIVAAGKGERFGAPDKVFLPLGGRPLIAHILDTTEQSATIRDVVLVVGEHTRGTAQDLVEEGGWSKVQAVVTGGDRRQESVVAGLSNVSLSTEIVVIHDGARPLVTAALFDACIIAATSTGAAIAAAPITDTVKRVSAAKIVETIPREHLWAAQTPQAFRIDLLRRAVDLAARERLSVTDEASILEAMGVPVVIVPSTNANLKITHLDDLWIAEALYAHRSGDLPEIEP